MWYPANPSRPLEISFFLDVAPDTRLHETQFAGRADELADVFPNFRVGGSRRRAHLDGSISVVHAGEELLGTDYWIEFITCTDLYLLVCHDTPEVQRFNGARHHLCLTEHAGDVIFELRGDDETIRRGALPFASFVAEWTLMKTRVRRVAAALGDATMPTLASSPLADACGRLRALVEPNLLAYTIDTPLAALLTDPVPVRSELDARRR